MRKYSLIAAGILLAFTSVTAAAYTDTDIQIANNRNLSASKRTQYVKVTANELGIVRAALQAYYLDKQAFPATLALLKTSGYYSGDFKTVYGPIVGAPTANGFDIDISLPAGSSREVISKMIAVQSSATQNSGKIKMSVSAPSSAIIVKSMLSRIPDASNSNSNKMMQGINLNNFDLDNVKHIDVNNIDVFKMKVGEDLFVSRDTTIGRNLSVTGNQTVDGTQTITGKSTYKSVATFEKDVVINGKIDAKGGISSGSTTIVDADGTLYDQGVKLRDVYSKLKANNEFKGSNTFTGESSFIGGINSIGGITSTGVIKAASVVENGIALESKYLGISATAVNADKLGNVAANKYSRIDQMNTFTAVNRFLNNVTVDKRITAASFKGGTFNGTEIKGIEIFENGASLKNRYLSIDAIAKNAKNAENADNAMKLGNVDASKYVRIDQGNRFTGKNTFVDKTLFNADVRARGNIDASSLSENGLALQDKYLAINATAKNALNAERSKLADRATNADNSTNLGGLAADKFARRNQSNTFKGTNTFVDKAIFNNGLRSKGTVEASTLLENGVRLEDKYLGINDVVETARNALKLGNEDAVKFARRDQANTFNENAEFNKKVIISGVLSANKGLKVGNRTIIGTDGQLYDNGKKLGDVYSKLNGNNQFNGKNSFIGDTEFKGRVNSTNTINAKNLSEDNVLLSRKYLGIDAAAANALKLGDVSAGNYARRDVGNIFNKTQRFKANIIVNNDITANAVLARTLTATGKIVTATVEAIDIVENGVSLIDKYLGIDATANKALNTEKLGGIAALNYARLDVSNTFQGLSIFNSQGQFKKDLVVNGMLTAASILVTGDININGVATARDFELNKSISGKRTLSDALKWINECELGKIEVCKDSKSNNPGSGPIKYAYSTYSGANSMVFNFGTGDIAGPVKSTLAYHNDAICGDMGGRHNRYGCSSSSPRYERFKVSNPLHKNAFVTWSINDNVIWRGRMGQFYTPKQGQYDWVVSIEDENKKVVAQAKVHIKNGGWQKGRGSRKYDGYRYYPR